MSVNMVEFLKHHTLLHGVPEEELEKAAVTMQSASFADGEWLMHEGMEGDDCFFIAEGRVQVISRSLTGRAVMLAELGPGALIGEIALIRNEKRTAGIKAAGDVMTLRLDRAAFERLAEASPYFHESLSFAAELRYVHGLLRKASIWSAIPDSELRGLAEITVRRKVSRGQTVVREGDTAQWFYMVASGRLEAYTTPQRAHAFETGDYFGETALLTDTTQSGTVTAVEDSELLVMGKTEFLAILQHYAPVRRQFAEVLRIRRPDLTAAAEQLLAEEPGNAPAETASDALTAAAESPAGSGQPKPSRWMDTLLAIGGGFVLFTLLAAWLQSPLWSAAALTAGSLVGPVTFVAFVRGSQLLGFRASRLAWVFVSSAAVAVPLAWIVERAWLFGPGGASFAQLDIPAAVALIEEAAKLIICTALLRSSRMRFLMDAVVFGAAAGMGFAAVESLIYGWTYLQQSSTGSMLAVLWVRALLSPLGHGTWTAIAATGVWYGLSAGAGRRTAAAPAIRWLKAAGLLIVAVVLHAVWDYHGLEGAARFASMIAVGAAGLLILYGLIRTGTKEERHAVAALNPTLPGELRELTGEGSGVKQLPLVCAACGTQSPPHARYCARCGQALRARPDA
ncbi:Cyclic nucleotide-gated potassium channel [Paenibacillus konkukensis]|uniref:Cyclic nucleotide-gated potassium channel n=1 Tax=Paenibacillus konkukensis TaxID=2020716 RepID=A0ABY4RWB3_9BACL|nr:cyclic nucleotide-binding domain-containing protein [Paenibacillus konkukensis]UQZ85732.1 Cyclic nucleotide-gated potassium channel [Paenibacillus konkukensis]